MSSSPTTSESALAESLRPRLHSTLQPLLNHASPCLSALEKTCQKILSLTGGLTGADCLAQIINCLQPATCHHVYSPHHRLARSGYGQVTYHRLPTGGTTQSMAESPPNRQRRHRTRALVAAMHANEPGLALKYPSLSQLVSATLLYSIGDLAIASQSQDLYVSYRRIPLTAKTATARIIEETQLYGVPRLRIAQALGQMWALPRFVVELFSIERHQSQERLGSGQEMFKGLVIGCSSLVDAMTGPPSPSTMEAAKGGSSRGAACRRTCSATSLCAH